jgi:hypothetical protein
MALWCQDNNLSLNVSKTKELIVDFRKQHGTDPRQWDCSRESGFKFLSVHINEDLIWTSTTITLIKRAQQHLYFLR